MPDDDLHDAWRSADEARARLEEAAAFLEQARQANPSARTAPDLAYRLARTYRRLGRTAEARALLRAIPRPDAPVFLEMGLCSLLDRLGGQAEGEFARAWELDPGLYAAGHNLLLTRLGLGRLEACRDLLPQTRRLAPTADEGRRLDLLGRLLDAAARHGEAGAPDSSRPGNGHAARPGEAEAPPMSDEDEEHLLQIVRGLGQQEAARGLLAALAAARPHSRAVREAHVEAVLLHARARLDRADALAAERLLRPLSRLDTLARPHQALVENLLGVCCCLNQDFPGGIRHFAQAVKLSSHDARLAQNLALAWEWHNDPDQADPHWHRFFDLLHAGAPIPHAPGETDYADRLAVEGLMRLAQKAADAHRTEAALRFARRLLDLRPRDADVLERLFQMLHLLHQRDEARQALRLLREVRPDDPQAELHDLELEEPRTNLEIERLLNRIDEVRRRHKGDPRVEARTAAILADTVLTALRQALDRLNGRLDDLEDEVESLPSSEVHWPAVREEQKELEREYARLRKLAARGMNLAVREEARRPFRDLMDKIDRRARRCRRILD